MGKGMGAECYSLAASRNPSMDEESVLRYIFKEDFKTYREDGRRMYRVCVDDKYMEFECDEEYPCSVPEFVSNVEKDVMERVKQEAVQYISTPMIFDMVRLTIKALEECSINSTEGGRISVSYHVDDGDKITEEDFLAWRAKNVRAAEAVEGLTGKEIFLEKRRNKKDCDEDSEDQFTT